MVTRSPVDWPALIAEVFDLDDDDQAAEPGRDSRHENDENLSAPPEPATWRARFATFRADLDALGMTALALDVAELPEPATVRDHRAAAITAGLCPQCLHSTKDGAHSRYGSHCRWTEGRSECLCQGPIENRGPR